MLHFTPARRALSLVVALLFTFGRPFPASAQTVVEGSVSDAAGKPVAGVAVLVSAPAARASAQTDSSGRFRIEGLPPGTYAIDVRAARFEPYAGRIEVGEQTPPLQIVLSVSMPSLRVIGSVVSHPRTTFNDTPAAVKIFPREAYRDQGQPNLASVLAQTPGSAVSFAQSQNASIAGISSAPVVRASLPFETAVSIDGVAVSLPSDGAFDASLLPSSVLADVEIGKGPGDVAGIAPNAIAGSLNLRTTDPTATRRALFEFSSDDRGGAFSDFAYGGTMPGDKVAFAAVITTDGAIGPLTASSFPLSLSEGTIVNGHALAGGSNPLTSTNLTACCVDVPADDLRRAQLLKVRFTPSDAVTLTGTYLGSQSTRALSGAAGMLLPLTFEGSTVQTFASTAPTLASREAGRFSLGDVDVHVDRARDGWDARVWAVNLLRDDAFVSDGERSLTLDGIATYADGNPPQTFQNDAAAVMFPAAPQPSRARRDALAGARAAWQHQVGKNLYTLALEQRIAFASDVSGSDVFIASGSRAEDTLFNAAALLHPSARAEIDAGAALAHHGVHVSQDGGATYADAAWNFVSVRAGGSLDVRPGLAVRASFGTSYAPPPLDALSAPHGVVLDGNVGLPDVAIAALPSRDLQPESALGYDAGAEWRLHGNTTMLSGDLYRTVTHGAFVLGSDDVGVETWFNAPTIVDDGIELSLVQFKRVGLGFIAQGSLLRDRVTGALPASFYDSGTSNLAILPGQNINGGGFLVPGNNGIGDARVPYAQGYGELSYKWPRGSRLSAGVLYVGANNPYDRPAFATLNSNLELSLGPKAKLQLSIENLFNALDGGLPLAFGGIGVPLADGGVADTNANVLAPRTIRIMFRQSVGAGGVLER